MIELSFSLTLESGCLRSLRRQFVMWPWWSRKRRVAKCTSFIRGRQSYNKVSLSRKISIFFSECLECF